MNHKPHFKENETQVYDNFKRVASRNPANDSRADIRFFKRNCALKIKSRLRLRTRNQTGTLTNLRRKQQIILAVNSLFETSSGGNFRVCGCNPII